MELLLLLLLLVLVVVAREAWKEWEGRP